MLKKISLILINILICYILFFRINQLFYYTLIIPFLLTLINTENPKYYFLVILPMFIFNMLNASIILIAYISLYIVYKRCNIKYLYLTSFLLSASISLIFKYYYQTNFSYYAPLLSLLITIYQLKFKNTPNEVLIFLLITQIIIIDNPYFILITLTILFLYIIYNKTDYLFMVGFLLMMFHFYILKDYLVVIYPLLIYTSIKKEKLFNIIILLLLVIYSIIYQFNYNVVYSSILIILILFKKEIPINSDYYTMLLDSFNNEVMNFCSFLDNFKVDTSNSSNNITTIITTITRNHCTQCPNRYDCFGVNKLKTYKFIKQILKDNATEFDNYCIKYSEVISNIYSLKKMYYISFNNSNDIQVNGLSKALREYSIDLASKNVLLFTHYTKLKEELINYGFIPIIFDTNFINDGIDLKIGFEKRFDNIAVKLHSIASRVFNKDLSVKLISNDTMYAYYIITNRIKYNVIYDSISVAKSNFIISGDNMYIKKFDNGYFKACIADGMGSGFDAYELSSETIKLVERISNQNIHDNTSINILNTFYSLNDCYDMYSTLDYLSIDLKTGLALIYKMGATTTFIIKDNNVIPIFNKNLPFGIDDMVTKEEIVLNTDDLVIMISDGVTEHIDEEKLTNFLYSKKLDKPHQIVYDLMQKVYSENNNVIKDDMSIIALRIVDL